MPYSISYKYKNNKFLGYVIVIKTNKKGRPKEVNKIPHKTYEKALKHLKALYSNVKY